MTIIRAQRDFLARQALARLAAVVPCPQVLHDLQDLRRTAAAVQDFQARLSRMGHHHRLVHVQRSGLQQDVVRHADDADVVQQGGDLDGVAVGLRQVQLHGPSRAGHRHPQCVRGHQRVSCTARR